MRACAAALRLSAQALGCPRAAADETGVADLERGFGAVVRACPALRAALVRVAHPVAWDATHGVPTSIKGLPDGYLGFIMSTIPGTEKT